MRQLWPLLLLVLLTLPACDDGVEVPIGDVFVLLLEGTNDLEATCTITLRTETGTSGVTFTGLIVPDEADLGIVLGASATCGKEEENGTLRLRLLQEGVIADEAETTESFGTVTVSSGI